MTGPELRAWRDRLGLTLDEAADRLDIGRRSLIRYEAGERPIPASLIAQLVGGVVKPAIEAIEAAPRTSGFDPTDPKHMLAPIGLRPDRIPERDFTKFPLDETKWQRMGDYRIVSALIPDPIPYLPRKDARGNDVGPYAWIGPRGVINAAGDAFDYETGRKYTDPTVGAPTTREKPGARQFAKTYKR